MTTLYTAYRVAQKWGHFYCCLLSDIQFDLHGFC